MNNELEENTIMEISQKEAKEKMEQGGVVVLDVRTEEEYQKGHIPKAILLPNESIENQAEAVLEDKDKTILVYCRSGIRSKQAVSRLSNMGYSNVYDFGGILDWEYEITR